LGGREYYSFEIINTSKKEFMQYYLAHLLIYLPTDNPVGELNNFPVGKLIYLPTDNLVGEL
jgi:hypothetical protein